MGAISSSYDRHKLQACANGGGIYHTNSKELRDHYTKIFEEAEITNFQFKITK